MYTASREEGCRAICMTIRLLTQFNSFLYPVRNCRRSYFAELSDLNSGSAPIISFHRGSAVIKYRMAGSYDDKSALDCKIMDNCSVSVLWEKKE